MTQTTKRKGSERAALRFLRQLASRTPRPTGGDRSLVEGLLRRGLVMRNTAGEIELTAVGIGAVRRDLAGGDGFAAQHQMRSEIVMADEDRLRRPVTVNLDESPLLRLRRKKGSNGKPLIDAAEFAAGERLRADFTKAMLMPRVTANWTAAVAPGRRDGGAGGVAELTASAIAARQRVERALSAVGPEFADLLVDVCCFLKGVEEIEREQSWPVRSAKLVVRLALSSLARHYGLSTTAQGSRGARRVFHWGADDYRPKIK
jgi:hypothetical protein